MSGTEGTRIRDARGREVEQLDPVALHTLHRDDVIERDALFAIVNEIEPGRARVRRHTILIGVGSVAALVAFVALVYAVSDTSARQSVLKGLFNPGLLSALITGGILVPWIIARQQRQKIVRFAMLKHRRCPHCGYDLRGTPANPADSLTTCSECGCAWLIDDARLDAAIATGRDPALSPQARRRMWILLLAGLAVFVVALVLYLIR